MNISALRCARTTLSVVAFIYIVCFAAAADCAELNSTTPQQNSTASPTAGSPQPQPSELPLPAGFSVCSTDNAWNLVVGAIPQLGTDPTKSTAILQTKDVAAILKLRIGECQLQITNAPAFAETSVKISQGFAAERKPKCAPLPVGQSVPVPADAIIKLYDQLDNCVAYANLLAAVQPPTTTFRALHPTLYVIVNSGAPSASSQFTAGTSASAAKSSSANTSSSGSASSGAGTASSSTATTSGSPNASSKGSGSNPASSGAAAASAGTGSVDYPNTLMAYSIARQLGYRTSSVDIIPASAWQLSDFNNQCLADPPTSTGGTWGAISIDEATVTNGGSVGLVMVNGWTKVRYSLSLYQCNADTYPSRLVWHGLAEGQSFRNGISMLPVSTYLTYLSTKWIPSSVTSNTGLFAYGGYQAASSFVSATSGLSIGDTSSTMTVPRAYDDAAHNVFLALVISDQQADTNQLQINAFCSTDLTKGAQNWQSFCVDLKASYKANPK